MALESGDIVQITDETHHWFPALIIVSEPKSWGIKGYALIPHSNKPGSQANTAYIRLEHGQFELCGSAIMVQQ